MMEFDYVIAGGGSAGCVLAGRLSEDPSARVCLLEAGGAGDSWVVNTPAAVVMMVPTRLNNWAFETVPQAGLEGRRGYQPRGCALGGSSAMNAMVYIRGHRSDYDRWAALGNQGWSYREVLPYFKRAEHNETHAGEYHGRGGPLNVAELRTGNPFQEIFLKACEQAGFRRNPDFNGAEQEGVGAYQVTQKDGERWSAARAYVQPHLSRPNLKVLTGARARRVVLENRRATGVECVLDSGIQTVKAKREVVVSAGALQSPQLLMLSGIGDGGHLQQFGIPVAHHLPGVGRNLRDHVDYVFGWASDSLDLVGTSIGGSLRLVREIARYRRERRGMITTNYAEAGGFLKTAPAEPAPDVQLHFVVGVVDNHARTWHFGHGYSLHVCLLRPKSAGRVSLASADPRAAPAIDPNFYGEPADLEAMVRAFKLGRRILEAPSLAATGTRDLFTAQVRGDDDIRATLRQRSDTIYHPVGSCRMGADDLAVVDSRLRVRGIDALRVVDASVMPDLIGGNTNAPTIMIAEKAADFLRAP
ncbi:MAG TPA: GMC family oxidoreductase N-terminal domain-containing protein [Burkholderiales bacterium]|nr:GMC family oxidoreductase N-terminal domain-containing protein [Burkholderiales bacterium]